MILNYSQIIPYFSHFWKIRYNCDKLITKLKNQWKFAKIFDYGYNRYKFYSFINYYKMTKKQEALDKARESWKKAVKWWKKFGTWVVQMVWWTTWALGYTLLSGWEKVAAQISESREDDEWISPAEKKARGDSTAKLNNIDANLG